MDLRSELEAVLITKGGRKKRNGNVEFRCFRHPDRKASAWLGSVAWGCEACGFRESLKTLAEELGVEYKPNGHYRVEDYAQEKAFSEPKLRELGVDTVTLEDREVVGIPYYDHNGDFLRMKYRARDRMWWDDKHIGVQPYGLNLLDTHKAVLVVEGESDTHACYHHGVAALGIPGANTWRPEWAEYLSGRQVFVWQEPDQGGETFVRVIHQSVPDIRVIRATDVKDLADLHKKVGKDFKREINRLAAQAVPPGATKPPVPFDVVLGQSLRSLLEIKLKPVDAVPTPWPTWNRACRDAGGGIGLGREWHIIFGAASGTGKSVFGLNLAYRAMLEGERVTYVSLEMSPEQLQTRLLAIASGIPIVMLEAGRDFDRSAWDEAVRRMHEIQENHGGVVTINQRPIRMIWDIVAAIRYNYEVHGSRFFIIDYMQLARVGYKANDIYTTVTEMAEKIAEVSKDLRITTAGLSQLNRELNKENGRPKKEHLYGGAPLEQNADQVMLLWHKDYEQDEQGNYLMLGVLDKNRHGPKVDVPVRFDRRTLRIEERMPDER